MPLSLASTYRLHKVDDDSKKMEKAIITKHILDIKKASNEDRLVFFVGAGVSNNSGVPTWGSLISALKDDLPDFAKKETDDLKLAQIYKTTYPTKFVDKVKASLMHGKVVPNPVHDALLNLRPTQIVTTNYDNLLEQAFSHRYEQFGTVCCDADMPSVHNDHLLVKMHGDFDKGNIVLGEQDYYDYTRNFPLIRSYVLSLFATKVVVFIGFSFDDINLKYILRNLQVILQEKMQPVYLLTGADFGHEQIKYLEQKGIVPVCLTSSLLDEYEANLSLTPNVPATITNPHGKVLYRQLQLIRCFETESDPFISLIKTLKSRHSEWNVFGSYLHIFMPERLNGHVKPLPGELYIKTDFFDNLLKDIKTKTQLLSFCRKYKDIYRDALNIAFVNRIYSFNRINLFPNHRYAKFAKNSVRDGMDSIVVFNYQTLLERIEFLVSRPFSSSLEDIELPYIYYKLNRHKEAFRIYSDFARQYWSNRNYVLYMVCRFNMYILSQSVLWDKDADANLKQEAKSVQQKKLSDVWRPLPLDAQYRAMFDDVISNRLYLKLLNQVREISQRISKQRQEAVNGGWNLNNDAFELLEHFAFLSDFSTSNYIIIDRSQHSHNCFVAIAEGLFDSLMIEATNDRNSHLAELTPEMILLIIHYLTPADLATILAEKCDHRTIAIAPSAKELLNVIIQNLIVSERDNRYDSLKNPQQVSNCIHSICLLLCYLPVDCMPDEGLYTVIAKCMRINEEKSYTEIITTLMAKKKPSVQEAKQIIGIYLNPMFVYPNTPYLLSKLSEILVEANEKIDFQGSIDSLKRLDAISLSALYDVFPEESQQEIFNYLRSQPLLLYQALVIELNSSCHILDEVLLRSLLTKFIANDDKRLELDTSIQLKLLMTSEGYEAQKAIIQEELANLPCLQFLLKPTESVDKMQPMWILGLLKEELKPLLNNAEAMAKIDHFSKTCYPYISKVIHERVWEALTTK